MQQLVLPDKEDFRAWMKEIKQELITEIRKEVLKEREPEVQYMTRRDIAKKYNISLVTLTSRTNEGLPSIKIGKRRLYNPVEVERYLKK